MSLPTTIDSQALAADLTARIAGKPEPAWLLDIRREAVTALAAYGWPNCLRKQERWRFFPTDTALRATWEPSAVAAADPGPELAQSLKMADAARIVMVDGRLAALPDAVPGVTVLSLADAFAKRGDWLADHLARYATGYEDFSPAAVATAQFEDAVVIHVTDVVKVPLLLEHHASGGAAAYPRLLLVADDDSALNLSEVFVGPAQTAYRVAAVSETVIGARAHITHARVVLDGNAADHMLLGEVRHAGDAATYKSLHVIFGAGRTRLDINVRLDAERLESTINGTFLLGGDQVADIHTRIEHLKPHSISHELVKGILAGKARGVFNGRIFVDQAAQKTDAYQANPNLLLSNDAVANSNPELEIYADDVRCSHGATYGTMDHDALFYMQARGLSRQQAEEMLVYAFASDVLMGIAHVGLRDALSARLGQRLAALRAAAADR